MQYLCGNHGRGSKNTFGIRVTSFRKGGVCVLFAISDDRKCNEDEMCQLHAFIVSETLAGRDELLQPDVQRQSLIKLIICFEMN